MEKRVDKPQKETMENQIKRFKSWVAFQKVVVMHGDTEKTWGYCTYGPKDNAQPLVMIPGVSGTSSCFFRQFLSLPTKGYRLISVDAADYELHIDWCKGLDLFLDAINVSKAHFFGVGLGGYLLQLYSSWRPNRVLSLILCNTFCDTTYYKDRAPCAAMFHVMPLFMLQRTLLNNFPKEKLSVRVAEAVDFMVEEIEHFTQPILASRLILNCTDGLLKPQNVTNHFDDAKITILQTSNQTSVPVSLQNEVAKFYPNAKLAMIKGCGDFPFLSAFDEINLHMEVHLRRHSATDDPNTATEEQEEQNQEGNEKVQKKDKEEVDDQSN